MKLPHFLVLAVLTVVLLGAPGKLKRSDLELPPGAYWESENIVVIQNDPLTWEELAEMDRLDDLKARDKAAAFASPAQSLDNTTLSLATPDDDSDPAFWADLWMTADKQLVGTLRGQRLWNRLYDCFSSLCKISDGLINCFEQKKLDGPKCRIPNIVNNPGKKGKYDASASLYVTYRAVHHSPNKADLDLATYEMVAAMFKLMTEQDTNCYWVDFQDSRKTKLCSIGQQVLVAFPVTAAAREPDTLFIGAVSSTATSDEGDYMCNYPLRTSILDFFRNKVRAELAKATDRGAAEISAHVRCVEDTCMGRDSWKDCIKYDDQ